MNKSQFIQRVAAVIDESGQLAADGGQYFGAEVTNLDRHIEEGYVDAWRTCVNAQGAQRAWFKNCSFDDAELHADLPQGTGFVVLPADFYLLTSFKMKGWVKPVFEATLVNDRALAVQSNEFTRGSRIRPSVMIDVENIESQDSTSVRDVMRYFSLPKGLSTHEIEKAIYVPIPRPLTDPYYDTAIGGAYPDIELSQQVLEPVIYVTGSNVMTLLGKYPAAEALMNRAVSLFPGLINARGTVKQ
ncbi:MAG: hypothetical protein LBS54_03795 [Dysgonamonadaceae bacterium]|jgi:hypothetical protein|nr:hypothetical protein [Dysgonamonadaceae bacterium]